MLCNCKTKKGLQCSLKAKPKSKFCTIHKNCFDNANNANNAANKYKFKKNFIYLCNNKCTPIKHSDIILKMLNDKVYESSNFTEIMYKTLQKLYPKACFLHPIDIFWDNNYNVCKMVIESHSGKLERTSSALNIRKYKRDEINNCSSRLLAIPVGLPEHANLLIVDTINKEVEHFEPHGKLYPIYGNEIDINDKIEEAFRYLSGKLFPDYTYIPRTNATNFQTQLNKKFVNSQYSTTCNMWSLWYAYLRLSNPNIPREEIIKHTYKLLGKNNFSELEKFIVKFIKQMMSYVVEDNGGKIHEIKNYYVIRGRKIIK